jgi:putative intracellular protease/amidase
MSPRILHVVTNRGHFDDPSQPAGLWLPSFAQVWDIFAAEGFAQDIVSPAGGFAPLEPRSLDWPFRNGPARAWLGNPARMALLKETAAPEDIDPRMYDAISFAGGHGTMWDVPDCTGLQAITRHLWEEGAIVSAIGHGCCGLLKTRLSNGALLIAGRHITGFSWTEDILLGVSRHLPYKVEAKMTQQGARYDKALLPFASHVVLDGQLVTGQNPRSARETARLVAELVRK